MIKLAYPKLFKSYETMEGGIKGLPKDEITDKVEVGFSKVDDMRGVMNSVESKKKSYESIEYLNVNGEFVDEEEAGNYGNPFGYKFEKLYTLSDRTEILYTEQGGRGGSYRSWNIITTGKLFSQISYEPSLPICYGNGYSSIDIESLGRLISIKEPRLILPTKQHGEVWLHQSVSYELEFEKRDQLNQITIHLHPDATFDSLFLVTFFGVDPSTIEATDSNFPKYIYTAAEDVSLVRLYPKEIEV